MIFHSFLFLGFDDESPRSNLVETVQQDPDNSNSGLIEGSETEDGVEFSDLDEEDIEINGPLTSEDSVQLRYVNIKIPS